MRMEIKRKRFAFVDYYGMPVGIENTDNLQEAIENANQFQCEIIDTQDDNRPVCSVWDGWNEDWRKQDGKERL